MSHVHSGPLSNGSGIPWRLVGDSSCAEASHMGGHGKAVGFTEVEDRERFNCLMTSPPSRTLDRCCLLLCASKLYGIVDPPFTWIHNRYLF